MMQRSSGAVHSGWENWRKEATRIERYLENKLPEYSTITKQDSLLTTNNDDDIENPSNQRAVESQLALDIEKNLQMLSNVMEKMSNAAKNNTASTSQRAIVQRYRELYIGYKDEFKSTKAAVQGKRDLDRLLGRSHDNSMTGDNSESDMLLSERSKISSSRSIAGSVIGTALAAKEALDRQGRMFTSSRNRVTGMNNTFTAINGLVSQIKQKKMRNNTIIALVIAGLICFTIWWMILS